MDGRMVGWMDTWMNDSNSNKKGNVKNNLKVRPIQRHGRATVAHFLLAKSFIFMADGRGGEQ